MARAGVRQGTQGVESANSASGMFGNLAGENYQTLVPFLTQELHAQHTLTPQQTGELMNEAEAGSGGAASGITGAAQLKATQTRNEGGLTGVEDQAALRNEQAQARAGEGVASKDIGLTIGRQNLAAKQLQGLYGANTGAMLRALGLVPQNINAETGSQRVGWLQDLTGLTRAMQGAGGRSWSL